MKIVLFILAVFFIVLGHLLKTIRWKQLTTVYEKVSVDHLASSLSIGYLINFCIPFRVGDLVRAYLAGRKMKNGFSFSVATVIWDRFLDVLAVAFIFLMMHFYFRDNQAIQDSAFFYVIMAVVLVALMFLAFRCSGIVKKVIRAVSWIFNEKIELSILFFCWALISAFKEIVKKVQKGKLLLLSIGMWCSYLCSYSLLAKFFSFYIKGYSLTDLFLLLFSRGNVDRSSAHQMAAMSEMPVQFGIVMAIYLLSTIVIILLLVHFHKEFASNKNNEEDCYILPQINPRDRLHFLENYFDGNAMTYMQSYLALNRDIQIIRDFSAGSKATTMLCMKDGDMFFRKYILGEDAFRLHNQVEWIEKYKDKLALPKVERSEFTEGDHCFYDMEYQASAAGLFSYIHSNSLEESWSIIETALGHLWNLFYSKAKKTDSDKNLKDYINQKVIKNLAKLKNAKELQGLYGYKTLEINGKTYRNLCDLEEYLDFDYLLNIFRDDLCSEIHGDLTVENIIAVDVSDSYPEGFYLIDPNVENSFPSYFLDYAKLLQSLHGGYEFLMNTEKVKITGNKIQMLMNKSRAYDELYLRFKNYLNTKFTEKQLKSIYYHEIIHWLRLMPYKLEKNGKNALIFYAGMIIVMNDIVDMFEKNN